MTRNIRLFGNGRRLLFPVAVLTRKWCRCYNRGRVCPEVTKRGNLINNVRVVACNAVFGSGHVGVMVPLLISLLNVIPTVAVAGKTVPFNRYPVFTVRATW